MSDNDFIRRGDARKVADEVFDRLEKKGADQAAFGAAEVCEAISALPAQGVDALVKAAGEWKDARDALNAFETENPGNTTKRWANLLRDAERTEEAFWSALAAYRGEER